MANNRMTVSDRMACGGVFADVKRIMESGNETYIDCLRKSLAAYIYGIEIDEGFNVTMKDLNERTDRLEKIMEAEKKEREETEQRKARAKAKAANSLTNEFRVWLYREKRGDI